MGIATVSSKYQIVIPKDVSEKMDLKPEQRVIVVQKDGVMHLIPEKPIKKTRGFVKCVTIENLRHEGDQL